MHPPFHLFNEFIFRVHDGEDIGFPNPAPFSVIGQYCCELVVVEVDRNTMLSGDHFQLFPEEIQPGINACVVVFRLGVTDEVSCFLWPEDGDRASKVLHNRIFSPPMAFSSSFSQGIFLVFTAFHDEASAGGMGARGCEEWAKDGEAIGASVEGR